MKTLQLTNSDEIIMVDNEDYYRCNKFKWCLTGKSKTIQATTSHQKIANFIMGKNYMYDHKDRNPFNNQKNNLRQSNMSQNGANRYKYDTINATSQYKGVYWLKNRNKWCARITVDYKGIYLGCFLVEEDAAKAYNIAATRYFGEFAYLNVLE